ncbi:DoxX family protein [Gandjariella thermophila]|uniref:DoxX family protein n=1 Tax=Gandjariella thermophila TaxID=1931992 RepID=UPI0027D9C1CA|nr:DoxX family protein [Gandjariella thermophila]
MLSTVRIVVSFLFMLHGVAALFGVLGGGFGRRGAAEPLGQWPSWWAGLIQLVGGGLILLGLFTRPAAIVCSGTMAYAYFSVHQPRAPLPIQNAGELAALYSWFFLLIAVLGAGPYAVDTLRHRLRRAPPRTRMLTRGRVPRPRAPGVPRPGAATRER